MLWGSPVIQSACDLQPCFRRIGVACVCIIRLGQHRGHSLELSGHCSRKEFVCWSFVSLQHLRRGTQHVSILWCGCSSHYQQVELERVCPWLVSGRKTHDHQPCPFKLCFACLMCAVVLYEQVAVSTQWLCVCVCINWPLLCWADMAGMRGMHPHPPSWARVFVIN
jgi:hypothetical protein